MHEFAWTILAIFAGMLLNVWGFARASKDIEKLETKTDARLLALEAKMDTRFLALEVKMDANLMQVRSDLMEFWRTMGQHDARLDAHDEKFKEGRA